MMTYLNAPELDQDALMNALYEIQTSLQILIVHLARDRNPDLATTVLLDLADMHRLLQAHYPSLNRH